MSCQDELKNCWIEKNLIFCSTKCVADWFFIFPIIPSAVSLIVLFPVLMWTAVSHLAELHLMDSPVEPLWTAVRVWCCRTASGGNHCSTSLAVNMTWPALAPCPVPLPCPQSSVTRRTSSWRRSLRSWPAWGLWGVTTFTWPTFPAGLNFYYNY